MIIKQRREWATEITYDSGEVVYMFAPTRSIARYRAKYHLGKGPDGLKAIKTRSVQRLVETKVTTFYWQSA